MRKYLKIFGLFLVSLLINVVNVKAAISVNSYGSAGYFGGEEVLQAKLNINGANTTAYCHNPGVLAFTQSEAENKISLLQKRVLGDTKNGRTQNIFDAGLMSILTNSNRDNGTEGFSMAKYIAVNLYEQLFPMMNTNGNNGSSEIPYLRYIINTKLYDSVKGDLKTLASKMGSYNVISSRMSGAANCSGSKCGSSSDINSAVSMVKTALKTAINYANNGEATATIGNGIQTRITNTDDKGKVTYKDTVSHTITIVNFGEANNQPRSVKLNFSCDSCKNVTTKFYINDQAIDNISSVNLLDYTNNGTGSVQLKIEFTGTTCEEINYTLTANYTHYTVTRSGYSTAKCSNSNKCQGFYAADASSAAGTKTTSITNKLSLCQTTTDVSQCTAKVDNVECVACVANEHEVDIKEGYTYANDNTCDTSGATLNIKKCIANDGAIDTANHTYKNSELTVDTKSHNAGVYCKEDYHLNLPGSILVDVGRYFTLKSSIRGTQSCYTNDLLNSKSVADVKGQITSLGNETVDAWNQIQYNKAIAACVANASCYSVDEEKKVIKELREQKSAPLSGLMAELTKSCGEGNSTGKCYEINGQWYYRYWTTIRFYDIRPVINIHTSYTAVNTGNCGTKTVPVNITLYGDWLGRSWSEAAANRIDCLENSVCDAEVEHLTAAEIAAALDAIGRGSTSTLVSGGNCVGGKVSCSPSYRIGEEGSGLMVHLGGGSIASVLSEWNKATGYNGVTYPNDFDDTPFDAGWKMSYNFDPEMYFWYQEEYMKQAKTDQMDMYDKSLNSVKAQYCEGTISDDYQTCSTGWTDIPSVENGSVCVCTGPNQGDCSMRSYVLSKVRYVVQSQDAEAKFITPTQFYSLHPSGSIVVADQGKSDEIENSKELTNGLPVGLGSNGTRRYVLWYEKLGEYFDTDKLGRVWGESDSVVSKLLKDRTKCNTPESALVDEDNTQGVVHDEGVYACKYSTDCPESCKKPDESSDGKFHCKDGEVCDEEDYNRECCPSCPPTVVYKCAVTLNEEGETVYYDKDGSITNEATYKSQCCPNGECPVTCSFCLYDGNKLNVQYRPITSEDVNPNDRDLGKNWSWEEPIDTTLELKAYVTTNEIEDNGDSVYDVNFDNIDENNDFAMQVTMDGQMISKIRSYNRDHKEEGYANNTLECYDLKNGEELYENVFCYSQFLDNLLEDSGISKKIKINLERPTGNERKETNANEKYFTSWIGADTSKWNVTTTKELAYYKENYGMVLNPDTNKIVDYHVGPSWK